MTDKFQTHSSDERTLGEIMSSEDFRYTIRDKILYVLIQKYSGIGEQSYKDAIEWTKELIKKGYLTFSPIIYTHNLYLAGLNIDYYEFDFMIYSKFLNGKKDILGYYENIKFVFAPSCFKMVDYYRDESNKLRIDKDSLVTKNWNSKGAYNEWLWCKQKGIKCILLEPLLKIGIEVFL